jgi:hypothetical protein
MAIDRGDPNYGTGSGASTDASDIAVADSGSNYTGTDVEAVLAEISDDHIESTANPHSVTAAQAGAPSLTNLASTSNGQGASLVGVEDAAGNYTATDVEAALAEVYSSPPEASTVASVGEQYGKILTSDGSDSSAWGQKVWKDLKGVYRPDSGPANPTVSTFIGSNIDDYSYATGDSSDFSFHMPHDYAVGTDIYIHVHWGHNGTGISGTMQWDLEITRATRNAAAPFATYVTPITTSISNSATVNITNYPQHCHVVEEIQLSAATPTASQLDTDNLLPDDLILVHVEANTIPSITGGIARPFLFTVDIHYQADIEGTKNKDPNFYT